MTRFPPGTWIALSLTLFLAAGQGRCAAAADFEGRWLGTCEYRGAALPIELEFWRHQGALRGRFSSPGMMILERELETVRQTGPLLEFEVPGSENTVLQLSLRGDYLCGIGFPPDLPAIQGADSAARIQVALRRAPAAAPPGYRRIEVSIPVRGARLSGTLYLPASLGRAPAVTLLQGSSETTREYFRWYADRFCRAGFVALIFDKRGSGRSTGNYLAASTAELVADAAATVRFLKRRAEVDSTRVGIWGLSQGALLSPRVAAAAPVAFVVAVSGPSISLGEVSTFQDSARVVEHGFSEADGAEAAQGQREILRWLREGARGDRGARARRHAQAKRWFSISNLSEPLATPEKLSTWYWSMRTEDPIPAWRALPCPALILYGERDDLIPGPLCASVMNQAMKSTASPEVLVRLVPGADHTLRKVMRAGEPFCWPTEADGYFASVVDWMRRQVGR